MVNALSARPDLIKLVFIDVVEFQGRHFADALEVGLPQAIQLASGFLRFQDQVRGIPPIVLARSFIGLFFSYFMTGMIFPGRFPDPQGGLTQFVDIYLHGILEPK